MNETSINMGRSTTEILALLETERAALRAIIDRTPAPLRARRPAPERWSIVEVLEHLTRVETGVARLLTVRGRAAPAAQPAEVAPADAQLDAARIARLRDRNERIEAPERIRPAGTSEPAEALRALAAARAELVAALVAADPAALDGVVHTHAELGPLTLRGWAEFVAHHEARHADQVREIAAAVAAEG
jgi:hypothetical protein